MEEFEKCIKQCKEKIRKIEDNTEILAKKYLEEKGELKKIVRGDFLAGGITASSFFIIISSIINYYGITYPYDFWIGVIGFIIGLIILCFPVIKSRVKSSKSNKRYLDIIYDFKNLVNQKGIDIKHKYSILSYRIKLESDINMQEKLELVNDEIYDLYKKGIDGLNQLKKECPTLLIRVKKTLYFCL